MKNTILLIAVLSLLIGATAPVNADFILSDTFGPDDSFNLGNGVAVRGSAAFGGYFAQANAFTPTSTSLLDSVSVATFSQASGSSLDVLIANDNGSGHPGTTLENLGVFTPSYLSSISTLDSTAHSLLTAGTIYWLIVEPTNANSTTAAGWCWTTPNTAGSVEVENSPSGTWQTSQYQEEAFEITGAAVPEPSSFMLLGLIASVSFCGWRLKYQSKPGLISESVDLDC